MTEPVAIDADTATAVRLAGKDWPIPELVWRDLRKCRRELIELNSLVNAAIVEAQADLTDDPERLAQRNMSALAAVFEALSNEDYDRLVMGPIFAGLTALHPALKREELDGWPTTDGERHLAWLTVRRQSGLFVFGGESASQPGEAGGAA